MQFVHGGTTNWEKLFSQYVSTKDLFKIKLLIYAYDYYSSTCYLFLTTLT